MYDLKLPAKSKVFGITVALLAAGHTASHTAWAADTGTSKENPNIEAQGRITDANWLLKNGQAGTSVEIPFTSKGATGPVTMKIDLSVNAIDPTFYDDVDDVDLSFLNVEAKVNVLQGKSVVFAPALVRADAVKALFPYVGITLQGLGYEMKEIAGIKSQALHFGSLTVNEAIVLKEGSQGNEVLALIVKGKASFGIGASDDSNLSEAVRSHFCDKKEDDGSCDGITATPNEVSGSIGLRIMNSALVEVYGGLDQISFKSRDFRETTVGAKVRGLVLGGKIQPYANLEKRMMLARAFNYQEDSDSVVLTIGVEANW